MLQPICNHSYNQEQHGTAGGMFERQSQRQAYRDLVKTTEVAPVLFECIPPSQSTMQVVRASIYRAAGELGVKVRVVTVDETGTALPPGNLNVIRVGWQPQEGE